MKLSDFDVNTFQNILSYLQADDIFKLKKIRNHLLMFYLLFDYKNNFWNDSVKVFAIIYSLKMRCHNRDVDLKKIISKSRESSYLDFFQTLSKQLLPSIVIRIDVAKDFQNNMKCKSLLYATLSVNNLVNGWIARIEKTKIDVLIQSKQVANLETSLRTLINICQKHSWIILDINIVLGCPKFSTFKIRKPLDDNPREDGSSGGAFDLDEFLVDKEFSDLSSSAKRNLEIYNIETQLRVQSESIISIEQKIDNLQTLQYNLQTLLLNLLEKLNKQ